MERVALKTECGRRLFNVAVYTSRTKKRILIGSFTMACYDHKQARKQAVKGTKMYFKNLKSPKARVYRMWD